MVEAPYWDPYTAAFQKAPYDAWRRLRDDAPVYRNDRYNFYAVSRFEDVLSASLDTETFSSAHGITLDSIPVAPAIPMMIMMDPPKHDLMRKVVNRVYTPRRVGEMEQRIRELCGEYLDPLVGAGGFDYVADFGARLPVMVISTLLGFPEQDHDQLREWSDLILHREDGHEGFAPAALSVLTETHTYYYGILQQRRSSPQDDFISALCEAELTELDGTVRKLDDMEVLGMIGLISNAGNETVARMLGWASMVLCDFEDQRALLVKDPSMIPAAIEELLRFEAPSPIQGRYVTRDVEMHGTVIPGGSTLAMLTGSAGRDERQYSDADQFIVRRESARHLSLGYGAHFCLGAALARLEGRVALEETLLRFPTWNVDRDKVEYVATNTVRGPASVPITF
jgi:cytochrome P450